MCLIVFAWQVVPGVPLIAAANRDEFYERAAAPAAPWPEFPHVFAGRDLKAGGSWMGITRPAATPLEACGADEPPLRANCPGADDPRVPPAVAPPDAPPWRPLPDEWPGADAPAPPAALPADEPPLTPAPFCGVAPPLPPPPPAPSEGLPAAPPTDAEPPVPGGPLTETERSPPPAPALSDAAPVEAAAAWADFDDASAPSGRTADVRTACRGSRRDRRRDRRATDRQTR